MRTLSESLEYLAANPDEHYRKYLTDRVMLERYGRWSVESLAEAEAYIENQLKMRKRRRLLI